MKQIEPTLNSLKQGQDCRELKKWQFSGVGHHAMEPWSHGAAPGPTFRGARPAYASHVFHVSSAYMNKKGWTEQITFNQVKPVSSIL